jgi:predicted hotdog family 3-hydroxylacyl-ACP dehydratase
MNWTQEPDPDRLALLDRLVHANRALWEAHSVQARLARTAALRAAMDAGCGIEQIASALGVHASEVEAVARAARPAARPARRPVGLVLR